MSRIETSSKKLREQLEVRNLYSVGDEYGSTSQSDKVLNSIRSITNVINPINKLDNNLSALYARIVNPTPIVKIGMKMLADQFAKTIASNAGAYASQMVSFKNVFDGDKSTKFWVGKDYQITIREDQSKIGKILQNLTGYQSLKTPFTPDSGFKDYLENTGSGQLSEMLKHFNRNKFIPEVKILQDFLDKHKKIGSIVEIKNILDMRNYPTSILPTNSRIFENNEASNASIKEFIVEVYKDGREYSSTNDDVIKYHGRTSNKRFIKKDVENTGNIFEDYTYGFNNGSNLIWGFDGVTFDKEFDNGIVQTSNGLLKNYKIEDLYDIKVGLLKYTAEMVNSSKGKIIDITRKKFFDPNNPNDFVGYNGAGIFKHSFDSTKDGMRQHTVLDPYDKFAKAIRFDGNKIYSQGNPNSVIYDTVIPKIHPTYRGGKIDNRNMMFSIENLAVEVTKDEANGYAYLNDEYSTTLPISEAGPFGGRVMWFPPYDVKFREQSSSKIETNWFVGRNEPLYTYNGTERTANLEFKLLIDYPLNVLQYRGAPNFHQKVSEFFLFGGLDAMNFSDLAKTESELAKTNEDLTNFDSTVKQKPNNFKGKDYDYYFPNDVPEQSEIDGYDFDSYYEDGINDDGELNDFGLNFNDGTAYSDKIIDMIKNILTPENSDIIDIEIKGFASKLNDKTSGYNESLSLRRAKCVHNFLNTLYETYYGKTVEEYGYNVKLNAYGSSFASDAGISADSINEKEVKMDRRGTITLTRSTKVQTKEKELTPEEQQNKDKLINQKADLEKKIAEKKQAITHYDPNSFKTYTINDKVMTGFEPVEKDIFIPCFHSQTPEDFHRRLTFLQQCLRQGRAVGDSGRNSIFGKQPVCILRIGDFQHTRIIIETLSIDYSESTWDMNPEGLGMQPMICDVSISFKIIGGQSLATPIQTLQNATTFNYYANSTFLKDGMYSTPVLAENLQLSENLNANTDTKLKEETKNQTT